MLTGQTLAVASVPAAPNPAPIKARALSAKHEQFAAAVAGGESYAAAYAAAYGHADITAPAVRANASRLASSPAVAARVRELQRAAAEHAVVSIAARFELLNTIALTDMSEVARVVNVPCPECWSDTALAAAVGRAVAGLAPMPDTDVAQPGCKACRGLNRMYDITPTDQLSAAGRAIFRGVKLTSNGLEPIIADRQAAVAELNRMQPGALAATRSINANLNINVPLPDNMTPEAALAFLDTLKPS